MLIAFTLIVGYLLILWANREMDPNARTPQQARREAIDAQHDQASSQPVHEDSRETVEA